MTGARTSTQYWNRGATTLGDLIVLDDTGIVTSILPTGPVATANTLRLPGIGGNYASTPDSVPLSITSDIDLRVKVAADVWASGLAQGLVGKWTAGTQRSWRLGISTTGGPFFSYTTDGSTQLTDSASTALTTANGTAVWIRVTHATGSGQTIFYTSPDGSTWTQLGTTVAGTTGAMFDSTSAVEVGSRDSGQAVFSGYVYSAQVLAGINGTVVANFDATTVISSGAESPSSFTGPLGNVWTINGSAWWWAAYPGTQLTTQKIQLDPQYVQFDGTSGNYASTPDSAALSITGDIDIRVKVALDDWTPSAFQFLMAKTDSNTQCSWSFGVNANGSLGVMVCPDGLNASRVFSGSVIPGFVDGSTHWLRFAWVDSTNAYTTYQSDDGVNWTTIQTGPLASAGIFDGTAAVTIGSQSVGGSNLAGKVFYAEIRNGIGGAIAGAFQPTRPRVTAVRTPTSLTAATGEVWTLNGSVWAWSPTVSPLVTTPDSAALSITGDLDLRAKGTMSDWRGIPGQVFLSKRTTTAGGYTFRTSTTSTTGQLELAWSTGAASVFSVCNATIPFNAGDTGWVRVTLDVDNGASGNDSKFYTSSDGVTWTQLGSTNTVAGVTTIGDSTDALEIGSIPVGTARFMGQIHYAEVRNGIGGTVVGVFNPAAVRFTGAQTPTTLGSPTGETWSVSGSGWAWVTS